MKHDRLIGDVHEERKFRGGLAAQGSAAEYCIPKRSDESWRRVRSKDWTDIDVTVQNALGSFQKLFMDAGLQHVTSPTRLKRGLYVCGTRMHRDKYQLHAGQAFLDLGRGVDAVQQRHRDVHDNQIRCQAQRRFHQGPPVRHGSDDLVMRCENRTDAFQHQGVVVSQ